MALTLTPRLSLPQWGVGTDSPTRLQFDAAFLSLDQLVAVDRQGARLNRPAPGLQGTWFSDPATGGIWRDNGTAYVPVGSYVTNENVANVVATRNAVAGQTADLEQWQVAGTTLARVDNGGNAYNPTVTVTGQPGAALSARIAGGTATGAPTTGTFQLNDVVVSQSGTIYVCTVAGTPGTWVASGGTVNPSTTLPQPVGTAAVGTSTAYARGDHSHAGGSRAFSMTLMGG